MLHFSNLEPFVEVMSNASVFITLHRGLKRGIFVQILEWLMEDQDFFHDLFQRFKFAQPGSDSQVEIVAFLQELTNLSKCLQQGPKRVLFHKLVHLGVFEVFPATYFTLRFV